MIRIRWTTSAAVHAGFYADYVYLVSGLPQPGGSGTPLTIGPIDTKTASPNGAVIENNILYNQTASQTNPGLLSPADKTKLDSLHSDYFIENEGDGEELATQVNDSTVGIKSLKAGTGVTLASTDTTVTINATAGSQTVQQVFDTEVGGSVLTKSDTILSDYELKIIGNSAVAFGNLFSVTNSSTTGRAINALSAGTNSTIQAINTKTSSGGGGAFLAHASGSNATATLTRDSSSTATVIKILELNRTTSGSAADGIGGAIHFGVENSSANIFFANSVESIWKNSIDGSKESMLRIRGVNNTVEEVYMDIQKGGIVIVNNGADTLAKLSDLTGGGSYTDADARAAISLTTTGTSGAATYNSGTGAFNIPDYSGTIGEWDGSVIGTTFSPTGTTISTSAVQWTFTGSSPATFTLPARTSSVNQFYILKNIGSADLTVAAAGTDDIFTTTTVSSLTVAANGGSVMITGAANGTSDLWTALFHTAGVPNLIVDSIGTTGIDVVVARNDSLLHRLITAGANISVDTLATGEIEISASSGGSGTVSTGVSGALAYYPSAGTTVDDIIGTANQIAGMNSGATAPEFKSLATGTSGTNFNIAHSANTVTFNIPDASGTATGLITATTQTIGGTKTFSGSVNIPNLTVTSVFSQNASGPNSILYMPTAVASGTANTAALLFEGAALVRARAFSNGSTAMAMAANESGSNWVFGAATTTEAASGTHAGIFGVQVLGPVINTGAGATTEAASFNVDGPPTGTAAITNPVNSIRVRTGNVLFGNGNLSLATAGNKLFIAEGSNSSVGRSGAMTAGSITISTTAVTANSIIQLTPVGAGTGQISIGTITAGTSFVINSSDGADTRIVHWTIIN